MAGEYSPAGEHDSQLCADWQRRGAGSGTGSGYSEPRNIPEIDLANPISLKEITKAATQGLERRNHSEGAAGQWLEPTQDGQVAQYQLPVAAL